MLESVDHINIVVNDLEAMVSFYTEVLGLKITNPDISPIVAAPL